MHAPSIPAPFAAPVFPLGFEQMHDGVWYAVISSHVPEDAEYIAKAIINDFHGGDHNPAYRLYQYPGNLPARGNPERHARVEAFRSDCFTPLAVAKITYTGLNDITAMEISFTAPPA